MVLVAFNVLVWIPYLFFLPSASLSSLQTLEENIVGSFCLLALHLEFYASNPIIFYSFSNFCASMHLLVIYS